MPELRGNPGNPLLLLDRAQLYCKARNFDLCLGDLDETVRTDPSPRRALVAGSILGRAIASSPTAQINNLRRFLDSLEQKLSGQKDSVIFELARHRLRGEILLADGAPEMAVTEFREAATLDAPVNSLEYLARALVAASRKAKDARARREMQHEAAALYAAVAMHPARVWEFARAYPPGFFADQVEAWLQLPHDQSQSDSQRDAMKQALLRLRPSSVVLSPGLAGKSPHRIQAPTKPLHN